VVFDHAELLDRMMDDEEMTQEILAVFLEELPRLIEGLQDYLDAGDRSGVQRQAHTIRGAAATVGGQALRALAFELEQAAQDGNLAAIKAGLNDLMAQFERLKAAILSITSKGDE
jgi:HPt (histidine-containing phosphotransfer) domain-containing protein